METDGYSASSSFTGGSKTKSDYMDEQVLGYSVINGEYVGFELPYKSKYFESNAKFGDVTGLLGAKVNIKDFSDAFVGLDFGGSIANGSIAGKIDIPFTDKFVKISLSSSVLGIGLSAGYDQDTGLGVFTSLGVGLGLSVSMGRRTK